MSLWYCATCKKTTAGSGAAGPTCAVCGTGHVERVEFYEENVQIQVADLYKQLGPTSHRERKRRRAKAKTWER